MPARRITITPTVAFECHPSLTPSRSHDDDAGWDLRAAEGAIIPAGSHVVVGTGVRFALPHGWVGKVHPRSSLGFKKHVQLSNGTGIIDAGFRGQVMASLVNLGGETVFIKPGERIVQILFERVHEVDLVPGAVSDTTERGMGGIGSSGVA